MPRKPSIETLEKRLFESEQNLYFTSEKLIKAMRRCDDQHKIIDVLLTKVAQHRLQDVMQYLNGSYNLELVLTRKES